MAQGPRSHHGLKVWRLSMELAADVYRTAGTLPREERYGLCSQIRRAAVSVPANIAEGAGRCSTADFRRFLAIARGSLAELETHLLLCEELQLIARSESTHSKVRGVRIMLSSLHSKLQRRRADSL
jgi:four helix bundle protein